MSERQAEVFTIKVGGDFDPFYLRVERDTAKLQATDHKARADKAERDLAEWKALDAKYAGGIRNHIEGTEEAQRQAIARECETAQRCDDLTAERDALAVMVASLVNAGAEVRSLIHPLDGSPAWFADARLGQLLRDAAAAPIAHGRSLLTAATRRGVAAGVEKAQFVSGAGRCSCHFARCGHDQAGEEIASLDIDTIVRDLEGK